MALLIATTVSDPAKDDRYRFVVPMNDSKSTSSDNDADEGTSIVKEHSGENSSTHSWGFMEYGKRVLREFFSPAMLLLLLAATFRQCAGFSWAYNTKPYFLKYYPNFDISYWILACSIGGGSFGVFFGGFLSDRVVSFLSIHKVMISEFK